MEAEDIKPDISTLDPSETPADDQAEATVNIKEEVEEEDRLAGEHDADSVPADVSANGADQKDDQLEDNENKDDDHKDDEHKNDDSPEEGDEDEDEDNIKVTIEDYDFKAIQKQAQPTKQAAPLVLETNQEPIDISTLDDKPWRKPGADINDYFNYGFDETTWRIYCDKQSQMRQIVNEINEPQETFKIPVVHAAPMVQQNVMPYLDERMAHVMDNRNAPLPQPVGMQMHHQPHHQHHNQQHHQHMLSGGGGGGGGRMKVEEDVKKYERRGHDRSSERRHNSKSKERRHSKSRERDRDRDKDKEKKRSRSRERRPKETRSRPRSRSREDERRSKRHKSSRHA